MEPWKAVAASILDTVKTRAKDFWDQNKAAQDFVTERAERLAKLTIQYELAPDDTQKEIIKNQMALVAATIETELLAVALEGQAQAKETFKAILGTVFDAVVKILPVVLAAV
jgi:hypothetical protein